MCMGVHTHSSDSWQWMLSSTPSAEHLKGLSSSHHPSAKAQLLLRNCRPCCGFLLILFSELHCTAAQRFLLNFPASAVSLLTLSASFSFLFFLSISVACLNQQWSSPGRAVGPTGTLSFPKERQWTSALCSRLGFLPHPGDREKNIWHRNRETPLKML